MKPMAQSPNSLCNHLAQCANTSKSSVRLRNGKKLPPSMASRFPNRCLIGSNVCDRSTHTALERSFEAKLQVMRLVCASHSQVFDVFERNHPKIRTASLSRDKSKSSPDISSGSDVSFGILDSFDEIHVSIPAGEMAH